MDVNNIPCPVLFDFLLLLFCELVAWLVLCYSNHDRSVKVGGLGELGVDFLFERFNPNTTHKNGRVILKSFQTFCTRNRPILPVYYEIKIIYQSSLLDVDVIDIKFLTVFYPGTFIGHWSQKNVCTRKLTDHRKFCGRLFSWGSKIFVFFHL